MDTKSKIVELLRTELDENDIAFFDSEVEDMASDLISEIGSEAFNSAVITATCLTYVRFRSGN